MSHVKKGHSYGLFCLLFVAAAVFAWVGWFASNPQDFMSKMACISLGVGLAVGVWLLVGLDASCQTRLGRFWIDLIIGMAMMALIYLFMLGFAFSWLFTGGAIAIVVVLSLLFAARRI